MKLKEITSPWDASLLSCNSSFSKDHDDSENTQKEKSSMYTLYDLYCGYGYGYGYYISSPAF